MGCPNLTCSVCGTVVSGFDSDGWQRRWDGGGWVCEACQDSYDEWLAKMAGEQEYGNVYDPCHKCGEPILRGEAAWVGLRKFGTLRECRSCFDGKEPGSQQEDMMERSVEAYRLSYAAGDQRDYDLVLLRVFPKGVKLPYDKPISLTWPAQREPHKCPGLDKASEYFEWDDVQKWWEWHEASGNCLANHVKHCPECGWDLNKPDPPGGE